MIINFRYWNYREVRDVKSFDYHKTIDNCLVINRL